MTDVVAVIGEALVDVVLSDTADPRAHVGGSPLNVAVGLARLGEDVLFVGRWGQDEYGTMIDEYLQANAVRSVLTADDSPTSVATARLDPTGAASYGFTMDWTLPDAAEVERGLSEGGALDHVHTGSIATMLEPGASTVMELLRRIEPTVTISYDPNCRPTLVPDRAAARRRAEEIVALADIVHASDEDLVWLYPDRTIEESIVAWQQVEPALVVVTRGAQDILCATAAGIVTVPTVPVEVEDTVGAGDSFTAALLAALKDRGLLGSANREALNAISVQDTVDVLRYAARAAAVTSSRPGADPPSRTELDG